MANELYKSWKPLRNFLRHVDPKDALEVLRYYSLYSGNPNVLPPSPPDYIEVPPIVLSKQNNGIYPWDMDVLAREVILNSSDKSLYRYSFKKWKHFSSAVNKLKVIDGSISEIEISTDNILRELFRLGHREFPHQLDTLNKAIITRYGKLFSHSRMEEIVKDRTGLTSRQILTIGVAVWGMLQQYAAIKHPAEDWTPLGIAKDDIEQFLRLFSKPFDELKTLVKNVHEVDNTFFYQYNPLSAYPLVEFYRDSEVTYVCPSVNRYQSQITRGLYYLLYQDARFDNAFGTAFEDYIGEVLTETARGDRAFRVYGEETDPSSNKRRCDWVIDQDDSYVLVECKTKRMAIAGYTVIDTDDALIEQLGKLADAVVQTYEGYLVHMNQGYSPPVYPHAKSKNASICVVTLEKWYLYGTQLQMLRDIVAQKLRAKGIDQAIVENVPFAVLGSDELEKLAFLASRGCNIHDMISRHTDSTSETSTWEFSVHMSSEQKEILQDYEYVFGDKMDDSFTPEAKAAFEESDKLMS